MSQNISTAVMQRRTEPPHSLDDYPTPPWATRALMPFLGASGALAGLSVREPSANRGHMVEPLREFFGSVDASDIFDYGAGFPVRDYLFCDRPSTVDWTITNPPFRLAEEFIWRGIETSRKGVAVIARTAFLEGQGRYGSLFSVHKPRSVLQFTERVVMHKGKLSAKGSTATAYCWIIFGPLPSPFTEFDWIAPCRKGLERKEDYL